MSIEFDEKGKFYTNVIQKVAVPSMIQTVTSMVRGLVHVRQDERFKDELENSDQFVAVTEASVCDASGAVLYSSPFILVRKEHIVWAMPLHAEQDKDTAQ
jgi:hypothetical protein